MEAERLAIAAAPVEGYRAGLLLQCLDSVTKTDVGIACLLQKQGQQPVLRQVRHRLGADSWILWNALALRTGRDLSE